MIHTLGQPNLTITPDRPACARYGLAVGDVEGVIQAAIGGQAVTQVFEGEKRFDLVVRWQEPYRDSVARIREILVGTPDGGQVPLGQIAAIREEEGPAAVYREDNHRYVPVKFSIRGSGPEEHARRGPRPHRGGRHAAVRHAPRVGGRDQRAQGSGAAARGDRSPDARAHRPARLRVRPRRSRDRDRAADDPARVLGGLLALLITGINFSVSAAMGFISIFGIAIQDGILVLHVHAELLARGGGPRGRHPPRRRPRVPPGPDDEPGRDAGTASRGALERDRSADPEAARGRRDRRRALRSVPDAARPASDAPARAPMVPAGARSGGSGRERPCALRRGPDTGGAVRGLRIAFSVLLGVAAASSGADTFPGGASAEGSGFERSFDLALAGVGSADGSASAAWTGKPRAWRPRASRRSPRRRRRDGRARRRPCLRPPGRSRKHSGSPP